MSSVKVVLGLLTGVAIGAAAGILLAPHKGSKTRKIISARKDAFSEDLRARYNHFVDDMTDKVDAMKMETDHMIKNGKAKAGITVQDETLGRKV